MDGFGMRPLFSYACPPLYGVGARGELLETYVSDGGNSVVWQVAPAGQWHFVPPAELRVRCPAGNKNAADWMMNGGTPAGASGALLVDPAALSSAFPLPLPLRNGGTGVFLPAPRRMLRPTAYQTPNFPPLGMAPEEDVRHAAVGKKLELKAAADKEIIKHDIPMNACPSKATTRVGRVKEDAARKGKQRKQQQGMLETAWRKKPPAMAAAQMESPQKRQLGKPELVWRKKPPAMAAAQMESPQKQQKGKTEEELATTAVVDEFPNFALLPEEWTY